MRIANGATKNSDAPTSAPISVRMISELPSMRLSRMSAALSRISRLTAGFVFDQAGKAASAASTARTASLGVADVAVQQVLFVYGLTTSNVTGPISSCPLMIKGTTICDDSVPFCVPFWLLSMFAEAILGSDLSTPVGIRGAVRFVTDKYSSWACEYIIRIIIKPIQYCA